ncbi:P1 family peptidase [Alphaproteobacteria bacterium]|nr:P1 family peptidase [Alphaproteobacteria bacterium]MDB2701388.1 P1 family peptidase [Alphaproteobacteria bacterium]
MKTITAPGSKNLITDVSGVQVGHAEDYKIGTGVTVITGDNPFSAAVDVRGGGPGTRETDMLSLENSIGRADAIVLSGGSAYGLDASSEIQDLLREDGKGYQLGKAIIPLVPSAVIFDLNINDNPHVNKLGHRSPWRNLANQAYKSCSNNFLLGSYGAGCGATTATLKGGQGSSSWKQKYSNGQEYTVGAIVINNAVGNPLLNKGPSFLSGYLEINKEFGGYGTSSENFDHVIRSKRLPCSIGIADTFNEISSNTVIGVVATDAPLSRANLKRLAIMAHDGIAKSLSPAHTPMDGDTIFAISTNQNYKKSELDNIDILAMGSRISDCVARACNRAVYEAVSLVKSKSTWKELFRSK